MENAADCMLGISAGSADDEWMRKACPSQALSRTQPLALAVHLRFGVGTHGAACGTHEAACRFSTSSARSTSAVGYCCSSGRRYTTTPSPRRMPIATRTPRRRQTGRCVRRSRRSETSAGPAMPQRQRRLAHAQRQQMMRRRQLTVLRLPIGWTKCLSASALRHRRMGQDCQEARRCALAVASGSASAPLCTAYVHRLACALLCTAVHRLRALRMCTAYVQSHRTEDELHSLRERGMSAARASQFIDQVRSHRLLLMQSTGFGQCY
jgi:hypothetical protein